MHTFSEKRNVDPFTLRTLSRCLNDATQEFQESNWIRDAVSHEGRERVGSIQQDVSSLLKRSSSIQAIGLQSWKKALPVFLGRDDDSCIPGPERTPDELSDVIEKTGIIRVEPRLVTPSAFLASLKRCEHAFACGVIGDSCVFYCSEIVVRKSPTHKLLAPKDSVYSGPQLCSRIRLDDIASCARGKCFAHQISGGFLAYE